MKTPSRAPTKPSSQRPSSQRIGRPEEILWEPTVPVGFVWDMIQASVARGIDVQPVLSPHGLTLDSLHDSGALVSVNGYTAILSAVMREQGDAFAGFLSKPVPLHAFPMLCYGLIGCRTIDEVLGYANAFYGMFSDDLRWVLSREADRTRVEIQVRETVPVEYRFVTHSVLLLSLRLFGWLYGEDIRALSVEYPFDAKPWDANLEYRFGCPVEHGCRSSALSFSRDYDLLELSCTRDQISQMLLSTRNLFFVSRWTPPHTQSVRKLLLAQRDRGWLSIEEVAVALGSTPNKLWRQLKSEGTSFLEIRDELKRDWALTLVENSDRSIESIAEILRYGDVSAFRKAFKKWTGLQPSAARANAVAVSRAYAQRSRLRKAEVRD